jgi:hypothetical protein
VVLVGQLAQRVLRLAARVVVPSSLPVAAVGVVASPQLTPLKLVALAVSLAALLRAQATVRLQPQSIPERRPLRVRLLHLLQAAAVLVAQGITPVQARLVALAASPVAVAVVVVAVHPRAALVAQAALAA